MPTPKQQRRRALELLEASIDGCTEAIMLAFCVSGDRCGDAVGFSLSTRRQCNGRRQAEGAGVTPRIARTSTFSPGLQAM